MPTFKRIVRWMITPWVFLSYLMILIGSYYWIDKPVATYFYSLDVYNRAPLLSLFTHLGKAVPYVAIFAILAIFYQFIRKQQDIAHKFWFLMLCVLVPNAFCLVLKTTFGRARPSLWFTQQEYGFYWFKFSQYYWSFPSSHTTTLMGLAIGLSILHPRFTWGFVITALSIASSRVFLYQHYVSDVLAALYLTVLEIGLLVYFLGSLSCTIKKN